MIKCTTSAVKLTQMQFNLHSIYNFICSFLKLTNCAMGYSKFNFGYWFNSLLFSACTHIPQVILNNINVSLRIFSYLYVILEPCHHLFVHATNYKHFLSFIPSAPNVHTGHEILYLYIHTVGIYINTILSYLKHICIYKTQYTKRIWPLKYDFSWKTK